MEGRKTRRILIGTLIGLIVVIATLIAGIVINQKTKNSSEAFDDKMERINSEFSSVLFSNDSTISRDDFITKLLDEILYTSDLNQKMQLILVAAYFYEFYNDYDSGISILQSIDDSSCQIDYRLYKLETLVRLYGAQGNTEQEIKSINMILELPDEELLGQHMSSVKDYYSNRLLEML